MALAGVELETLVSDTDALTTRPPNLSFVHYYYSGQCVQFSELVYEALATFITCGT